MHITQISKNRLKYELPEFKHDNTWIAGGAVRDALFGIRFSDIDVFGTDTESLDAFIENNLDEYKMTYGSEKIKTYQKKGTKVQVINMPFKSMEVSLSEFDFTACQFAMDNDKIICNADAILDVLERKIIINKIHEKYAIDTLRRLQKYIKKGFTICDGGLMTIANTLSSLDKNQVEEQFEFYPDGTKRVIRFD